MEVEDILIKKILVSSLAVGALTLGAPVAQAAAVTADCGFNTLAQETATGGQDTFTGAAYGFAVSDGGDVSVYCEVRVNGSGVATTPAGASGAVSTTAGQVTYTASDTDNVELCAVYSGPGGSGEVCSETTTTQIPPQEVIDAINSLFDLLADLTEPLDAPTCLLISALGTQGIVNPLYPVTGLYIDHSDCDVSLNGERLIDFSPYMDAFGPPN